MQNFIPYLISESYKDNRLKGSFTAYAMFVDISGFTELTETLTEYKKDGAEVLTDVLDIIFNPVVKNIYENKGFISSYAGDSFTAIFRAEEENISYSIINSALYVNRYLTENRSIETKYGLSIWA